MEVQSDFRDLARVLNEHKVEYLIVGGYALAFTVPQDSRRHRYIRPS